MVTRGFLGLLALGLGFSLGTSPVHAQQGIAPSGQPRGTQAPVNFADGDLPGPIDSLQDLQDTGKLIFKMADENLDGLISQQEAVDLGNLIVGGIFFRADANGDGKVTKDEANQARETIYHNRPWLRVVV
ncbi:MAG: hypothetical protein AB7I30_19930, partial [Isosphaeraceae bacterium]